MMHTDLRLAAALCACVASMPLARGASQGIHDALAPVATGNTIRLQIQVADDEVEQALRSTTSPQSLLRASAAQGQLTVMGVRRVADSGESAHEVLAFDQSASFKPYWERAFELARAWSSTVMGSPPGHTFEVMTFGKTRETCAATDQSSLDLCLANAEAAGATQQVTRLKSYIQEAVREAANRLPLRKGGVREVIVFTDAGDESNALKVADVAAEARALGVRIHVVCFASGSGKGAARRLDEMKELAEQSGGRYLQVEDLPDPEAAVVSLATALQRLYWVDLEICGAAPSPAQGQLSLEAYLRGARAAWVQDVAFRQSGDPSAAKACVGPPVPAPVAEPASLSRGAIPNWAWIALAALLLVAAAAFVLRRPKARPPAQLPPGVAEVIPPPVAAPSLRVQQPSPPAAPQQPWRDPFAMLPETQLELVRGPTGFEPLHRVHKSPFVIGAAADADLRLDLPQISSLHARMEVFKLGNVFITDQGSTNGTYLDGNKLVPQKRVPVSPGQVIGFGRALELRLTQPGRSAPAPVPPAAPEAVPQPPPEVVAAPAPSAEQPQPVRARTIYAPVKDKDS